MKLAPVVSPRKPVLRKHGSLNRTLGSSQHMPLSVANVRTHGKLTLFFAGPAAGAHGSVAPFDNVTLGAGVRVVTPVETGAEVHAESAALGTDGQDAGGEKEGNGGDSHSDGRRASDLGVWDRSWRA
ncbi:hypothetical protein CH63R_07957 [Colletotrichum higginsianum IMI 349063]|uniref:Uncharacterized protein n=1 Tax=Colletotrichum higginsianum (strain IMI 349063) TaxID=759273 RepID=A0A1B7YAU2_COLHI|nr:hypothetical protein CH63R_07957 [Colletotrichum higginsianum IMI 349063]OBR09192.1 hypothetical protein CH63R_07957 [Colletotrichum higginsianum IMI 349063]